ncbi:MAG: sensor domain-containing diguanylate cyclase [Nitrospirota bacterium]
MKKYILVSEQDKDILNFLGSFFKESDDYTPRFIKIDRQIIHKELSERIPAALIINSPQGLELLEPSEIKCPLIAIIAATNVTSGILSVVKSGVEHYLLSPFFKEDLEYKLKVSIERKNWFENLCAKEKDLETLLEFICLITSTLNPKESLYLIVKKLSDIINVAKCSMISIDIKDLSSAYVISTYEDPEITNIRLDLKNYPEIREAIALKKPIIIKDATKDPLMESVRNVIEPIGIHSIAVFPVIFHDEVIGTLLLKAIKKDHAFSEREMKLCSAIADASANALYNAYLYDRLEKEKIKLERLAVTDFMTGIYNIRYFYNRLEEEFSRARRHNMPLSCVMFDIDYFKRINDKYGHRIGDIVLRELAQLIRGCMRRSDIFARYGGEEFITLLPQTPKEDAVIKAEQIRKTIEEYQFMGLDENEKITVSVGIACLCGENVSCSDDLITFADHALFTAKNSGRNQIVAYHCA